MGKKYLNFLRKTNGLLFNLAICVSCAGMRVKGNLKPTGRSCEVPAGDRRKSSSVHCPVVGGMNVTSFLLNGRI